VTFLNPDYSKMVHITTPFVKIIFNFPEEKCPQKIPIIEQLKESHLALG
jgi:hypothetical protein